LKLRLLSKHRVSALSPIPAQVHHEGKREVNDDRRAYSDERRINKKQPYAFCGDACFFPQTRTNAKKMFLKKEFELLHTPQN
jgi:hypothetical protein